MKKLVLLIAFAAACSSSKPVEDPVVTEEAATPVVEEKQAVEDPTIELGREAIQMFYDGKVAELHARFSAPMLQALPAETWAQVQAKTTADLGPEVEVIEEATSRILDNQMYYRTVRFEKTQDVKLVLTWGFSDDGKITGFNIKPHTDPAPSEHLEYETKTAMRVPFDGEWTVIWGGRTLRQNYHGVDGTQRFALDLLVTGEDDRSHNGDPSKNENYYAFGKPVLAPASGKVLSVEKSVADNVPGEMNPKQLAGNYVFIDHGNGEYSLLAHFKKDSVKVKVGDTVEKGQLLGLCGNSGNSSEPHIHFHLQNSAEPLKGAGLPIQFEGAMIDGELRQRVELVQGQKVGAAE